jgi:hypothetical protein
VPLRVCRQRRTAARSRRPAWAGCSPIPACSERFPEAVYFTDDNGQRTAFLFLEMPNASQIPAIAEPWFLAFNASVEMHPVMVPDDLAKAGSSIEAAVNKYG